MNNAQKRTINYLREVVIKTRSKWTNNHTKLNGPITPIFNKRYENRDVDFTSKPSTIIKRYEHRNVDFSSKPKKPFKKYEDRNIEKSSKPRIPKKKYEYDDLWDIHHIQRNGGL